MELEIFILSKICQSQKDMCHMFVSYVDSKNNIKRHEVEEETAGGGGDVWRW